MLDFQRLVGEFHDAIGEQSPSSPTMPDDKTRMLRARLILEEAFETVQALVGGDAAWNMGIAAVQEIDCSADPNLIGVVDGIADTLFVLFGTADVLGVDMDPVFEEVASNNALKTKNGRDATGKLIKSPNHPPPRIRELLEKMGWQGK